jgi:hypothetical protein
VEDRAGVAQARASCRLGPARQAWKQSAAGRWENCRPQPGGDAGDFPHVVAVGPAQPERAEAAGEFGVQPGEVDAVGGEAVPVEQRAVGRRPPPVAGLHHVGDHRVGVQLRVALP